MGGTGTQAAAGDMLLAGDAAGLVDPLQGEGIGPGMVSAPLAAECGAARPGQAAAAYTEAVTPRSAQTCRGPRPSRRPCCSVRARPRPRCGCSPRRGPRVPGAGSLY